MHLAFLLIAAPELFSHGAVPVAGTGTDLDCARCHTTEYASWAASRHARAFTNPTFATSWRGAGRDRWCLHSHAPPIADDAPLPSPELANGVSCAVCHVRDGVVLSSHAPRAAAPHPITVDPRLAE